MSLQKLKQYWKKAKYFLWEDDSFWSLAVNIVLAFVVIKFLVYPGIGLLLGTQLPVVAVISESMEHKANPICIQINARGECTAYRTDAYEICGKELPERGKVDFDTFWNTCSGFYETRNITKEEFKEFPMYRGFNKGDIIILKGSDYEDINIGDIVVFSSAAPYPIIHRVVEKDDVLSTKGDHNSGQIIDFMINEKNISKEQVYGKAWIRIPYLGYIKIIITNLFDCVTLRGCRIG